jgi:radical SAM superfamily enzyme YgiQ (UPF0313 family)
VLEGENAIAKNRDLMGATDPKKAAAGTIRADFADSIDANAVHGSDAPETAERSRLLLRRHQRLRTLRLSLPSRPCMTTANLLDFDLEGLAAFCEKLGEKRFPRHAAVPLDPPAWRQRFHPDDRPGQVAAREARDHRARRGPAGLTQHESKDGTIKWLFDVGDGNAVEAVFIPEDDRGTLCVSSQAGCAVGCRFCSTGHQGFSRNLTTGRNRRPAVVCRTLPAQAP